MQNYETEELVNKQQREHLAEILTVEDEIMTQKEQLINLDAKRHNLRLSIKALEKNKDLKKTWLWSGNMFVKVPTAVAEKSLRQDFRHCEEEINQLTENRKLIVNKHRDLEYKDPLKGFNLKSLSGNELSTVMATHY